MLRRLFLFVFSGITGLLPAQFYYGSHQDFGKNRVQHNLPHHWTYYSYDKYNVYFYQGGREIAEFVAINASKHLAQIEKLFDFPLESKVEFIIYNSQSEFKASNMGLVYNEQANVGGVTRIVGSKVAVYFEGDHRKLEEQIRGGVAEVVVNQMMYGGNVKEMVKNSTFLVLPEWFTQGLISYVSNKYDPETENRVKDGIVSGRYEDFNHLTGQDATASGHSLWSYIGETYGENVISNILYMTKLSRNVENAFLFVLGVSVKNVTYEWLEFYKGRYGDSDKSRNLPSSPSVLKKIKASRVFSQAKVSPDGQKLAYVTNEMGQYKVWIRDLTTGKTKRIIKREKKIDRINDYSFPLLTWHPTGEILTIITEYKGELLMTYYTLSNGKKDIVKMVNFEKILDLSYAPDGKRIAISGVNKGQSDIYVFHIAGSNVEQITNDIYDDFYPRFLRNGKIIFSSNRSNDTLGWKKKGAPEQVAYYKDLFIYNYPSRSPVLKRVTSTPYANEIMAFPYDSSAICYLSDENGVRNRYVATFDSVLAFVDTAEHYRYLTKTLAVTNYSRNILEHDLGSVSGKISQVIFHDGLHHLYVEERPAYSALVPVELKNTWFADQLQRYEKTNQKGSNPVNSVNIKVKKDPVKKTSPKDSTLIDIDNYVFDIEKGKQKTPDEKKPLPDITVGKNVQDSLLNKPFDFGRMRNYNRFFTSEQVVTQFDNSYLNPTYQRFTGGPYVNPGFSAQFRIELDDLFEDYKIVGGARLPWEIGSNEFFIGYVDRVKLWDKEYTFHLQSLEDIESGLYRIKIDAYQLKYVLKYPFSEVAALKTTLSTRYDRTVYMAREDVSLEKPDRNEFWGGLKVEYIYDNTIKRGLNLYRGIRLKLFGEVYSQAKDSTDIAIVGLDIRHYLKIHRDFIWANRLSASTSFGSRKLVYYMGGVDAWMNPLFHTEIPISTEENYTYQTLAAPLRGFKQNIRNGNSFVLLNSELRMPLFRYLMNKPIRSDFLQNFQIIGFGDVGTAWNGPDPFSDENALNTTFLGGYPVLVTLKNQREPIVGGYGFGLRSRILGYFVRADWAWGVDDGVVQKPRLFYLSFSTDF
ncbi:MAG: PD40 domain-containing protein [Bacteroidia bacterium]|nr:PD40 domain-containing protein [Bacteroidia bacterium]